MFPPFPLCFARLLEVQADQEWSGVPAGFERKLNIAIPGCFHVPCSDYKEVTSMHALTGSPLSMHHQQKHGSR